MTKKLILILCEPRTGSNLLCEASRLSNGGKINWSSDKSPALKKQSSKAHKALQKLEADYEKEDTDMMIRLIKVRHGLWT